MLSKSSPPSRGFQKAVNHSWTLVILRVTDNVAEKGKHFQIREGGENVINYRILRRLRKLKDFNLADIAEYLGYASASSYHRLENGQIRPTVTQIRKLCQLYGVGWEALLGPVNDSAGTKPEESPKDIPGSSHKKINQ